MTEEIDIERTASVYKSQLDSFMSSFIMNCSPFDEDEGSLITESRARGCGCGYSWLDRARYFCSCHSVKSVEEISLNGYRPYLDIKLIPSLDVLTSNWFIWECRPCFEKMVSGIECLEHDLGGYTKSRFIDIQEATDQLEFLKNHVGDEIIMCYRFRSVNDFNKQRACYRFSKKESLREAILLTQGFVLDYLEIHPLDCFNGPFTVNSPLDMSYLDNVKKWEILSPILEGYLPSFRARKDWLNLSYICIIWRQRAFNVIFPLYLRDMELQSSFELEVARYIVEKTQYNLLLTGSAGSGKTSFLKEIVRFSGKRNVVLAPTGVAAVNAGGKRLEIYRSSGILVV